MGILGGNWAGMRARYNGGDRTDPDRMDTHRNASNGGAVNPDLADIPGRHFRLLGDGGGRAQAVPGRIRESAANQEGFHKDGK